jgi:hypothetical protein
MQAAGLLADGPLDVDVLKVPHHGSDRNVEPDYFQKVVAKHYVVSADGKHDNPDVPTLKMIAESRADDDFTVHLTYPTDGFNVPAIGKKVQQFIEGERGRGRKYRFETRKPSELSVRLPLA